MKKVIALLAAAALMLSLAACGGKDNKETTAQNTAVAGQTDSNGTTAEGETTEPETNENGETVGTTAEPATDKDGKTVPQTTKNNGGTGKTTSNNGGSSTRAPSTKAEILKYYNDATVNAYNKKVGFSKTRATDNEKFDANAVVKQFKGLIYGFMGIGSENKYTETVKKGAWDGEAKKHYLRKSTLSASDVTNAQCVKSGSNYVITLKIKDGSSHAAKDGSNVNASLDKCGICVGSEDKGYYDHKSAPVIYDAIEDMFSGAVIDETYSGATLVATVNASTGNLVSINLDFNMNVKISKVMGTSTASGTSHVRYSNFKY